VADLPAAIKEIANGPVPIVYDAISEPDTQAAGYAVLTDDGKLLLTLPSSLKDTAESKKIATVYGNVHPEPNRAFGKIIYSHFTRWLEEGIFVVSCARFQQDCNFLMRYYSPTRLKNFRMDWLVYPMDWKG
jgi:hypothetical protein